MNLIVTGASRYNLEKVYKDAWEEILNEFK